MRIRRTGNRASEAPRRPVDERLPLYKLGPLGLQHVLVMYSSTIAVPFIVAAGLDLPQDDIIHLVAADLLLCGIGTLLQSIGIWKVGARMPLVVGASFNLIAPMLVVGRGYGLQVMYGSIFASGVLVFLLAPVFTKLLRFFPPLVIGTSITLIGLNLMPSGIGLIFGQDSGSPDYGSLKNILLATACIGLVVVLYRCLPQRWSQLAILLSLLIGAFIGFMMGMMDTGPILDGPVIAPPEIFFYGLPEFHVVAIMSMMVVWLVMMIESLGQIIAVGDIVDKPATAKDVAAALRTDGLISALGGVIQSFGYITFTQNVGVVSLTKVRTRFVTAAAGVILVILSLFPILGRFVARIPAPVLGGVTLTMFATVAVIGIRILSTIDYGRIGNTVTVSLALGIGIVPAMAPDAYQKFPEELQMFLDSGVASGTVVVILLNLVFNHWIKGGPIDSGSEHLLVAEDTGEVNRTAE